MNWILSKQQSIGDKKKQPKNQHTEQKKKPGWTSISGTCIDCHGHHLFANKRIFFNLLITAKTWKAKTLFEADTFSKSSLPRLGYSLMSDHKAQPIKTVLCFICRNKKMLIHSFLTRPGCKILLPNITSHWFQHNGHTRIKSHPCEDSAPHLYHSQFPHPHWTHPFHFLITVPMDCWHLKGRKCYFYRWFSFSALDWEMKTELPCKQNEMRITSCFQNHICRA